MTAKFFAPGKKLCGDEYMTEMLCSMFIDGIHDMRGKMVELPIACIRSIVPNDTSAKTYMPTV